MAILDNFKSGLKSFTTGTQGSGINKNDWFGTPYGGNTIPEATLTKAQKTFSTLDVNPNFPKPKSLYFVYFHLNPALESRIQYKNLFIQTLLASGSKDGLTNDNTYKKQENKVYNEIGNLLSKQLANLSGITNLAGYNEKGKKAIENTNGYQNYTAETAILDYIPDKDLFNKLSFEMSKMVKSYDKPSVSFNTTEFNEYNRKRHVYTGVTYNDVKISFYDVKESPVQQFLIAYLKFICNDFFCKSAGIWERPIENNHWQNSEGYKTVDKKSIKGTYYGNLNSFGLSIDSNFRLIDKISFCEYYMNKMTVYTIENPVITAINFGNGAMGDFGYNDITVTFKYEGIHNDLIIDDIEDLSKYTGLTGGLKYWWDGITKKKKMHDSINPLELKCMVNHSIKKNVANFMQTKYKNLSGQLVTDLVTTLKSYMNGDVKFSWNTLKNQALDTARKYNMAGAANTYAQAEQTIKNYNSQDGKGKSKYLINMSTDPTSLIGKSTTGNAGGRGSTSGFFF